MPELPAALLGAELCLRAVYWGTCTKQKVAIFDGNSLGKGSFFEEGHVHRWKQERTIWTVEAMGGQGPHTLSTETCWCCTRTLPQCLESASWWASGSVTQLRPYPVSSCYPPWGRDAGSDPWPVSGIDQCCRQGLAVCPGDAGDGKV